MTEDIYPRLPPVVTQDNGHSFRLKEISLIKRELEEERKKRESLYKKYKKAANFFDVGVYVADIAGFGTECVALSAVAGVITAPVGIALAGAGGVCFGVGLTLSIVKKKIEPKLKKHDEIRVLAEAKLNTISEFVSKALEDNQISQTEFVLIKSELEKFYEMKNDIKNVGNVKVKNIDVKKLLEAEQKKWLEKLMSSASFGPDRPIYRTGTTT